MSNTQKPATIKTHRQSKLQQTLEAQPLQTKNKQIEENQPIQSKENLAKAGTSKQLRTNTKQVQAETEAKMSLNRRGIYEKSIDNAYKITIDIQFVDLSHYDLENRLAMLEEDWSKLEMQAVIYETMTRTYLSTRSAFRCRYDLIKPKVQAEQIDTTKIQVTIKENEASTKIPNTWGYFSGDCLKWPTFRDCFKVIHESTELSAVQKFTYLQDSLRGEAARVRGKLEMTDANYKIVWDRLKERYEDDYLIVHTLVRKMTSIKKLEKASSFGLRQILDTMRDCLGQLETYFDIKAWDPFLVFIVIDLFDIETVREWEKQRPKVDQANSEQVTENAEGGEAQLQGKRSSNVPEWKQLELFLEQQAKYFGHAETSTSVNQRTARQTGPRDSSLTRQQDRNQKRTGQAGTSSNAQANNAQANNETEPEVCVLCSGPHAIYRCSKWLHEMTLNARRDFMMSNNLCHICLKPSHGSTWCYPEKRNNKPCPRCPGRIFHNSTLCPIKDQECREAANALTLGKVPASTGARSRTQ